MAGLFSRGKNTVTEAERINDFQVNQATYGSVVPIIFGTTRVSGNIIDYFNFTAIQHSETQRTGKGGGSSTTNITYTYKAAVLVGIGEGSISHIGRVWHGSDTITTLAALGFTLFTGAAAQAVWDYAQSVAPSRALPYSGLAYVGGYVDLTSSGGLYNYNFETAGLLQSGGDGVDCNPADICNFIMTNATNGIGITGVNSAALANFKSYAAAADLLGSLPLTEQSKAYEIVNNLCDACDTMVFDSQGEVKFVPRCEEPVGSYVPDLTNQYDLDEDDFLPFDDGRLVQFNRTSQSETYNQATVEYINRANNYETEAVDKQVLADVSTRGLRPASTKSFHFFHSKGRAEQVAMRLALKSCYDRLTYTFRLSWGFCRLEPGDIVTLSLSTGPLLLDRVPVRIETVEEDADGELEITAKPLLSGIANPAKYSVFDSDRATRDYNVDPGDAAAPTIMELPTAMTDGVIKTSIATSGGGNWGGANVWVSDDGSTYKQAGTISAKSRYGKLSAPLPDSAATIDTVNTLSVDLSVSGGKLTGGTQTDARNCRTLCWVDGEIIAYATATLTGASKYNLSYLVRGCFGTPITSHAPGADFVRLDDELFGYSHSLADVGKTVYVKLQSINIFGAGVQDLSGVTAYSHTIRQHFVPQVTDLTCSQAYREIGDGTIGYELTLTWATPDADVYKTADVFMRSNLATTEELGALSPDIIGGVAVDRLGLDVVPWKQIGSGLNKFTLAGCSLGATYKFMILAKDRNDVSADFADAPTIEYIVAAKPYTPTMPRGFALSISDKAYASWYANTDTDVNFYELRTDMDAGSALGRLYRGSSIQCNPELPGRTGTLYLYAHNQSAGYGAPLIYEYSFPAPVAPTIALAGMFQGFVVTSSAFPTQVTALDVHIDGAIYKSMNNQYRHTVASGIFAVSAAFVDFFGEGALSLEQTITVIPTIDPELLAAESLSLEKMDAAIKAALEAGQVGYENSVDIVAELGKSLDTCAYTAISQAKDAIQLRAAKAELISLINVCPESVRILAKLIHLSGDTLIDDNLIVGRMIAADAVTAEKMSVTSLSAITATIGTLRTATSGARTEIADNIIRVYDSNNVLRVRLGVW